MPLHRKRRKEVNSMTPEQWLSEQIKEKGVKQSFIAENAGVKGFTSQKLSATLTGRRKIQVNEFIAVCHVIGLNPFDYPLPHAQGEANA